MKQQQKRHFEKHHDAQPLPVLQPGETVLIKTDDTKSWEQPGRVVSQCATRPYVVQTPDGMRRRNRRHLRRAPDDGPWCHDLVPDLPVVGGTEREPKQLVRDDSGGANPAVVPVQPPDPPDIVDQQQSVYTSRSGREVRRPKRFED